MKQDDDHLLVRECLAGNQRAFETIVDKYQKTVFNIALRIVNDAEDASDIAQSVFVKVYEHLGEYSPKYKFFSWLYKITTNESLNRLKQQRPMEKIQDDLISNEKNPEEKYRDVEISEKIQEALMNLNLDYRLVLVLNYFQDQSYSEISYIMGIPEKTVKSKLFTARKLLRNLLSEEGLI